MLSPNVHVLCGAGKPAQIEDTALALEIPLTRADYLRMREDADRTDALREKTV